MKKINYFLVILSSFLFMLILITVSNPSQNKAIQVNNKIEESLSNKKIGWGVSRKKDHIQPDLGASNREILAKYGGMDMGNPNEKLVYLTFDQGYEAGYTEKILNTLKENNVPAAFFITGHYLNSEPELVKRMINEGHTVGNHTVNHKSMPDITDEQIENEVMNFHRAVYQKLGYEMTYIRPPKGEFSERTLKKTQSIGYTTVMWSLAYDDWDENKQGREEYGKQKILDNIHPGAIILLHSTSRDNSNILNDCIKQIKQMGYEFKSLDEFVK